MELWDRSSVDGLLVGFDEHLRRTCGVCAGTRRNYTNALWLGHSSPAVTHQYLEADLAAKQAVLERLTDPTSTPKRFQPADHLVAFLQSL